MNVAVKEVGDQRSLADAVQEMYRRWPELLEVASKDSPVFVLAAGWRSGSTLLQRMLMPECMIWGEPYGHSCMLQNMADPLRCITVDWPEPHFFLDDGNRDSVTKRFVANLYPSVKLLVEAHRSYLETLLVQPAVDAGANRWGFKEVRLSADYAHYLKLLYPNSKFLFLIRNPYDAYPSWAARRNAGWKWFYRWPDQPVTARLFGRLWCDLAGSFVAEAERLDAHVVRYEDLIAEQYEPIESYLGFSLNRDAAQVRPDDGPQPIEVIPHAELAELGDEVHALAESLGYSSGTTGLQTVEKTELVFARLLARVGVGEMTRPKPFPTINFATSVGRHRSSLVFGECPGARRKRKFLSLGSPIEGTTTEPRLWRMLNAC